MTTLADHDAGLSHERAVDILSTRGYATDAVGDESLASDLADLVPLAEHMPTKLFLKPLYVADIEPLVIDRLHNTADTVEFARLFEEGHEALIGKFMYYGLRILGEDFRFPGLLDTLEAIAREKSKYTFSRSDDRVTPPANAYRQKTIYGAAAMGLEVTLTVPPTVDEVTPEKAREELAERIDAFTPEEIRQRLEIEVDEVA